MQTDANVAPPHRGDVVVPPYGFPDDAHNEDAHYTRLAIGFLTDTDNKKIPIAFHDPELEPLLFPDLFPDGQGYYKHRKQTSETSENFNQTYGKYIKSHLIDYDSRFRLHPWPVWSYLQLEKFRNFQNNCRLFRQKSIDKVSQPPTAAQLLRESAYTTNLIIDENITTPLSTFIKNRRYILLSKRTSPKHHGN